MRIWRHPVLPGAATLEGALWKILPGKENYVGNSTLTYQIPRHFGHFVNCTEGRG